MRKVVKIVIFLIVCFILLQIITLIFKNKHEVSYRLNVDNKTYSINEIYKNDKYYYTIKVDKEEFSFVINDIYHKDKKIIKDIKYYERDDLKCIFPMLKNSYITCIKDKKLYSYYYVMDDIKEFIISLESLGYKFDKISTKTRKIGLASIYSNNIIKNTNIYIWKYNGFYSISDELKQLSIYKNDTYKNDLGVLVEKYYTVPNYDDKYEYNSFYIYNITNDKYKTLELKVPISKNSYVNGVVDGKIYLFDIDNLIQYEINPRKNKINEVGNKEIGGLYYNGKFEVKSIYEFKDKLLFNKPGEEYLYEKKIDDLYYYLDNENNFYLYNNITKTKILLLNKQMSNISIIEDVIYYVNDNTLYSYTINSIEKPLVEYNELRFNPLNRIAVYKK